MWKSRLRWFGHMQCRHTKVPFWHTKVPFWQMKLINVGQLKRIKGKQKKKNIDSGDTKRYK